MPHRCLILSSKAFDKLVWFRDRGDTEIGGMCLTPADDKLYVDDVFIIKQECSSASVDFDEQAQHDYLMDRIEEGHNPEQFMRIWVHTHPGKSAQPSGTDWETFNDVLGHNPWSVMLIMAKDESNEFYCLFRYRDTAVHIPVMIDRIQAENHPEWEAEYNANVQKKTYQTYGRGGTWTGSTTTTARTGTDPVIYFTDEFGSYFYPKMYYSLADTDVGAYSGKTLTEIFGYEVRKSLYIPKAAWWEWNTCLSESLEIINRKLDWKPDLQKKVADCLVSSLKIVTGQEDDDFPGFAASITRKEKQTTPYEASISPLAAINVIREASGYLLTNQQSWRHKLTQFVGNLPMQYKIDDMMHWNKDTNNVCFYVQPVLEYLEERVDEDCDLDPLLTSLVAIRNRDGWMAKDFDSLANKVFSDLLDQCNQLEEFEITP